MAVLLPAILANEGCETALEAARMESVNLRTQLQSEQDRVESLTSVLTAKESDVQLAKSALQEMENDISQMDAEIKESRGREAKAIDLIHELKATVKELQQKGENCDTCQSDLDISKRAEKQLEAELANAFARIQILAGESKQLTQLTDELQSKVSEMEQNVAAATLKAEDAESELTAMRDQLSQSSASIRGAMNALYRQLPDVLPYWESVQGYVRPGIEAVSSFPALHQGLKSAKSFLKQATEQAGSLYSSAVPHVIAVYDAGKEYGNAAVRITNEAYTATKPMITLGMQISKEYAAKGYGAALTLAVQSFSMIKENSAALYNSQFVADMRSLASGTLEELQNYIQRQMWQIQSLQPFAKKEYVVFIVYTMLSLPPLFITTLLISCFGKRKPATPAAPPAPVAAAADQAAPPAAAPAPAPSPGATKKRQRKKKSG